MREYKGRPSIHFETGMEGVVWVLDLDNPEDYQGDDQLLYDDMVIIEEGDHLTVFGEDDAVLFDGVIVCDRVTGIVSDAPWHTTQQAVLGYWIHWVQQGWEPEKWARFFVRFKGEEKLFATLIRNR